jgi:lipopolysaccharide/colanic/teichoic acid biosynthesis glycosyltransferase
MGNHPVTEADPETMNDAKQMWKKFTDLMVYTVGFVVFLLVFMVIFLI